MRLVVIITFCLLFSFNAQAIIYTFHTAGDYVDVNNWDIYPGNNLFTNDTISIEANCSNIDLYAPIGYVVFSEDVDHISMNLVVIAENCQLEFLNDNFWIDILLNIDFNTYEKYILTPQFTNITIVNNGYGFTSEFCTIWENTVNIEYTNFGSQNAYLLECMDGLFINDGTIEVMSNMLLLNCDLNLSSGTILGSQAYTIPAYNGSTMQNCSSCVATLSNIEALHINNNTSFLGQVILNAP